MDPHKQNNNEKIKRIISFGKHTRNELFTLDKELSFTNHGSYGSVPKPIQLKRFSYLSQVEQAPDVWFRHKSFELWNKNRASLARFLNVDENNLVLTENASDSINSIVKSIDFDSNDVILANEYTYNAVLNLLTYCATYRSKDDKNVQIIKMPINYPIKSVQELLDAYDKICEEIVKTKKLRLRLVVLDHIASATATLYPVEKIISIIRKWDEYSKHKSLILIDGAHAIGQVDIRLNELDCDYYTSNLHKWFFAPRGCSFLYFRDMKQSCLLQPNIISHDYGKPAAINFHQRGTRDNTSWYLVDECISLYEEDFGGIDAIRRYADLILSEATNLLVQCWKTSMLEIPKELEAPFMKVIKLPKLKNYSFSTKEEGDQVILRLVKDLYERFKVDAQIPIIGNELYCRISCSVYNSIEDYIALKDAILTLINE